MALFTLTTNAALNLPPSQIGDRLIELDYNELYIFTVNDFTISTIPIYIDPEGDALESIEVTTLPTIGVLTLNAVAVTALDEITATDIDAGLLKYQADPGTTTAYTDSDMTFDVKDVGSSTFAGLAGKVQYEVGAEENLEPTAVGDNSLTTAYATTIVFTVADFTTGTTPVYADPEGDAAETLKITVLPTNGTIQYNGLDININAQISFTDIGLGLLVFIPDANLAGGVENFEFEIADAGSGIFVG